MNKIIYSKVEQEGVNRSLRISHKYQLVDSILKTHFKMLMRLTTLKYDYSTREGLIRETDMPDFLELVDKIEKSNNKRCATSHKKSIEKKAAKKHQPKEVQCGHEDLGSLGYRHGETVECPNCGRMAEVW